MAQDPSRGRPPLFSQIDVNQSAFHPPVGPGARSVDSEVGGLLRLLLAGQDRQNELLEELVGQISSNQRQRAHELGQWKQANPRLARNCRAAAEALGKVQAEFLESLTREVSDSYDNLLEGEFMLNEFVDRYGPRMAHLNGILQVLSLLSCPPNPANAPIHPDFRRIPAFSQDYPQTVGCVERTAVEMVGYARSQPLGNATACFAAVRATHHCTRASVLHPPYLNNPG